MAAAWKYADCEPTELLVLLAIADNADDDGYAFPGLAYLAAKSRLARSTVQLRIASLVERGYLTVEESGGGRHSNRYRVVNLTPLPTVGIPSGGVTLPTVGTLPTDSSVTNHHVTEVPPNPPQSGGQRRCKRHKRPRQGCADCQVYDLIVEWCGKCSDPDRRRIEHPETRADLGPCPDCHFSLSRQTAGQPQDQARSTADGLTAPTRSRGP